MPESVQIRNHATYLERGIRRHGVAAAPLPSKQIGRVRIPLTAPPGFDTYPDDITSHVVTRHSGKTEGRRERSLTQRKDGSSADAGTIGTAYVNLAQ